MLLVKQQRVIVPQVVGAQQPEVQLVQARTAGVSLQGGNELEPRHDEQEDCANSPLAIIRIAITIFRQNIAIFIL